MFAERSKLSPLSRQRFLAAAAGLLATLWTPLLASGQGERTCYEDATVIDGTGSPPQHGLSLIVGNAEIVEISPKKCRDLGVARAIHLEGRTMIPGLIESHVHLTSPRSPPPEQSLKMFLENGVTTVRDMGGDARVLANWRGEIRRGERVGPDLYFAANVYGESFLSDPRTLRPGYERGEAPFMRLVTEGSDVAEIVRSARETGVTGLKFYSGLPVSLISKVTDEAHRQGLQVWSHAVVWPTRPSLVSAAGVDMLTHAHGLFAEAREEIPDHFGTAISSWLPQQDFSEVDPAAEPYIRLFAQMKERGQILEPTLYALDERRPSANRPRARQGSPAQPPPIDFVGFRRFACEATRAAIDAGVDVAVGTDTFGRTLVIEEMLLLTNCGASPLEVIRAATSVNARALGIQERVGTIAPGMLADFVVLDSEPLTDLRHVEDVYLVVKRGEVVVDRREVAN